MKDSLERSVTQKGFLFYIEYLIRSVPIFYIIVRKLIRFTNIFEEDAYGVKILNYKKNKITIIDVGASDGIATKFFIKNLNVKKVFCFEPNIEFCKIINKKFKYNNTQVIVKNMAIGNKVGKTEIFIPNYFFLGKLFPLITYTFYDKKKCTEQVKKDFINYKNFKIQKSYLNVVKPPDYLNDIDLIKIDINGNEYDTLLSLKKIIIKNKPVLLIEGLDDMKKINFFLNSMGYECYVYKDKEFLKSNHKNKSLNYYFLQKDHLKKNLINE